VSGDTLGDSSSVSQLYARTMKPTLSRRHAILICTACVPSLLLQLQVKRDSLNVSLSVHEPIIALKSVIHRRAPATTERN